MRDRELNPRVDTTNDRLPFEQPGQQDTILNLKVRTESDDENNNTKILYEHYRKEVSTKSTLHYRLATGRKQKRSILSQELLTTMINCNPLLDKTTKRIHINEHLTAILRVQQRVQVRHLPGSQKSIQKIDGGIKSRNQAFTQAKVLEERGKEDGEKGEEVQEGGNRKHYFCAIHLKKSN